MGEVCCTAAGSFVTARNAHSEGAVDCTWIGQLMGNPVIPPQPARVTALEEELRVTREELRQLRVRVTALDLLTAHLRPRFPSKASVQTKDPDQNDY